MNSDSDISGSKNDNTESGSSTTPPTKKRRIRNCQFQDVWLKNPKYVSWLGRANDASEARCILCKVQFSIKYDGVKAVNVHSDGVKHKRYVQAQKQTNTIASFFVEKKSADAEKLIIAEITKTYHNVQHGLSYNSADCGNNLYIFNYFKSLIFITKIFRNINYFKIYILLLIILLIF